MIPCNIQYDIYEMIAYALLYGVTDKLIQQVQSVQNAAARLITGVEFKMASLVYQVQSSKVPGYLADDIHLASESSARSPRSSSGRK